jgi:hypothetical protein
MAEGYYRILMRLEVLILFGLEMLIELAVDCLHPGLVFVVE